MSNGAPAPVRTMVMESITKRVPGVWITSDEVSTTVHAPATSADRARATLAAFAYVATEATTEAGVTFTVTADQMAA